MAYSSEDLDSKVEFAKTLISDAIEDIDEGYVPEDRLPITQQAIGSDFQSIGIYHSLLGNEAEMRMSFSRAGEHYLEGVRLKLNLAETNQYENTEEVPLTLVDLLHVAVLSTDEGLIANAVETTREMDQSYLDEYPKTQYKYYYAKAYADILAGVDSNATIESLAASIPDDNSDVAMYYRAIHRTLRGLDTLDESKIESGLTALLTDYEDDYNEQRATPDDEICLPVAALALTARRRGIDVWPDSRIVPDTLRPSR